MRLSSRYAVRALFSEGAAVVLSGAGEAFNTLQMRESEGTSHFIQCIQERFLA